MDKEKDLFCEIIKDKLANYTLPVDDDSWNKIVERLAPAPRKKTQRLWIAAIAVPASIVSLFLILPIHKKTYHHEPANVLSNHEKTIVRNISEKEIVQSILREDAENSSAFGKSRPGERLAENDLATEVIPTEEPVEENPVVPQKEEPRASEKHPIVSDSYFDFPEETQIPPIKRKNKQSIRFSFGSGGNLFAENTMVAGAQNPVRAPGYNLNSGFTYDKIALQNVNNSRAEDILSYEDYPNVTHLPPLSFGITVKKELNRRFAIESGIVYSFLSTTFSKEYPLKSDARLQLHYIGIPLNVHTRIFGNRYSPWEVYISAGGMVEKGILSHFVQKTYYGDNDNSVTTVNSNEKIKGLQWSLGISPGVDYQIHKNYSIYLEPKLNYYFDNNQPVSARTEHPIVVGINAGVRYSW